MDPNSPSNIPITPIYDRTVAEQGDPREIVNEVDNLIARARIVR